MNMCPCIPKVLQVYAFILCRKHKKDIRSLSLKAGRKAIFFWSLAFYVGAMIQTQVVTVEEQALIPTELSL